MLTVKFLARTSASEDPSLWTSLLPGGDAEAFGVRYVFDLDARAYDFLVVYEDLPYPEGSTRSLRVEPLGCSRADTLFVTTEPTGIKVYGRHYLRQFGHVLSRQPREVVDHPGHIHRTPPLRPYYGRALSNGAGRHLSWSELAQSPPERTGVGKRPEVSMVCSSKTMTPELAARYAFAMRMREEAGVDVFGRGIRPIADKSEAMDAYSYHVAVENHLQPGHWTEKISDCFLAECLPFYHGDPAIAEAFPEDAVIPIDIREPEAARETIVRAMRDNLYPARLPAIREAKRRVLEDHNLLRVCADIARERHAGGAPGGEVLGRHAFRRAHPVLAARDAVRGRRMRGRRA